MIDMPEVLVRLGCAFVAGLVLGFERESHGRAAGLRTTLLVCVSSALAMIISGYFYMESNSVTLTWRPDPARLAAGVLTGMGFLGAGAIIRQDNVVRGVTTAAVLWFVTILGLAFGSGHFALGGVGFLIAVVILFVLPSLEGIIKNDWYASLTVVLQLDASSEKEIKRLVEEQGVKVKEVDMEYDLQKKQKSLHFSLKFKKNDLLALSGEVVHQLVRHPGVIQVKWI